MPLSKGNRKTRSSQKLFGTLASGQRTIYYRTIQLWNDLGSLLKLSHSVGNLKRLLILLTQFNLKDTLFSVIDIFLYLPIWIFLFVLLHF